MPERQLAFTDFGGKMEIKVFPPTPEQLLQAEYRQYVARIKSQGIELREGDYVVEDFTRQGNKSLFRIDKTEKIEFLDFPATGNIVGIPDYLNCFSGIIFVMDEIVAGKDLKGLLSRQQTYIIDPYSSVLKPEASCVAIEVCRQVGGQHIRWLSEIGQGTTRKHRINYLHPKGFENTKTFVADGCHFIVSQPIEGEIQETQVEIEDLPWPAKCLRQKQSEKIKSLTRRDILCDAVNTSYNHLLGQGERFEVRELYENTRGVFVSISVIHPNKGLRRSEKWQAVIKLSGNTAYVLQNG
ncbi:MAG: hypothetical protein AAB546_01350 [Patescibacteria group bacterium]